MKRRALSISSIAVSALLLLSMMGSITLAEAPAVTADGERFLSDIYTARTVDGVDLKVWHYRPELTSPLNEGAQPIIMMPGMACNFDFFDNHTKNGETSTITLPVPMADWAVGDTYLLEEDPMRYYSLAYYLWSEGYDVWMANYRGQGRDEVRSGGATGYSIDELGIYDMPAIITMVRELTGKKPIWTGHSMGGMMSYIYLQGCRFEDMSNPDSHVISDPALCAERNNGDGPQALKGLFTIDSPDSPTGDVPWLLETLFYAIFYVPWYLDIRPITSGLGGMLGPPVLALESLYRQIWSDFGLPDLFFPLNILLCFAPNNLNGELASYFIKNGADGFSDRAVVSLLEGCDNGVMREDYRNGNFNWWRFYSPIPAEGDGYYYYSYNMDKISLPTLILIDDMRDITNPENVKAVYDKKTRDPLDDYFVVTGSAHADIVMGLSSPGLMFPKIGAWLATLPAD